MNKYFNITDSVFNITESYPNLIPYLAKLGFTALTNPIMRKTMGKKITLDKALASKKFDIQDIELELVNIIESGNSCSSISTGNVHDIGDDKNALTIEGVLPCPVRVPLMELFEDFHRIYCDQNAELMKSENYAVKYDLKPASMGIDNIMSKVMSGDATKLPDISFLVGSDIFYANNAMQKYIDADVFMKHTYQQHSIFTDSGIDLCDPKGIYRLVAVVPAVFIVNHNQLNGRKVPKTWADILAPEFENSISIPLNDLDMFTVIIMSIYSLYGIEGIEKLARSFHKNLHPSQMVKANHPQSGILPAVNVTPYFFTRMIQPNQPVEAVWPEDGAIAGPIYLFAKNEHKNKIEPFINFLLSKETGDAMSAGGFFPSVNPEADNSSLLGKKFLWAGWDLLHSENLVQIMDECKTTFNEILQRR